MADTKISELPEATYLANSNIIPIVQSEAGVLVTKKTSLESFQDLAIDAGNTAGYNAGYEAGFISGAIAGSNSGTIAGNTAGYIAGNTAGYISGANAAINVTPSLPNFTEIKTQPNILNVWNNSLSRLEKVNLTKLTGEARVQDYGAIGDGFTDDTAAFTAAAAASKVIILEDGKRYRLNAWKPPSRCLIKGTKGATISKMAYAECAIDLSNSFVSLKDIFIDNEVYDTNGNIDPNRAGVSNINSFTNNSITVTSTHGTRFRVGMTAFWDSLFAPGASDTGRIIDITGDTLTFNRNFKFDPVLNSKIIADFPLIKMDKGTFASTAENVVMRRFIVGIKTAGTDGSAGNAAPFIGQIRAEVYTGAALLQMENMAAEMVGNIQIDGSNTVRTTTTASNNQTIFNYNYNVTPYMHRYGSEPSITATVNGVPRTISSINTDPLTRTVTLSSPCSNGDVVIVSNREWSPRGLLYDGVDGSVSGMGIASNIVILGVSIGCHIRGGTNGVQYLSLRNATIDTCSYSCLVIEDTNNIDINSCNLWYAPYPVRIIGTSNVVSLKSIWTTIMPSGDILNPGSDRPSRCNIHVDNTCTNIYVDRNSWSSTTNTIVDTGNIIVWTRRPILLENGSASEPSISFKSDPDTGFFSDTSGSWVFSSDGTARLRIGPDSIGIPYGSSGAPGLVFASTTSGLRRTSGNSPDRWQVDGLDRWFWGTYDVGPISVPLRLPSFSVSTALGLTNLTDGSIAYITNGANGQPCIGVRSGNTWVRVALGTAISST